jgi:hypothetical protein
MITKSPILIPEINSKIDKVMISRVVYKMRNQGVEKTFWIGRIVSFSL